MNRKNKLRIEALEKSVTEINKALEKKESILPKDWVVQITEDNRQLVVEWWNEKGFNVSHMFSIGAFYGMVENKPFSTGDKELLKDIRIISSEMFKSIAAPEEATNTGAGTPVVVNASELPKLSIDDLISGEWYKSNFSDNKNVLFLFDGTFEEGINRKYPNGCGFDCYNAFHEAHINDGWGISNLEEATEEEVTEALTKEAIRLGFVDGVTFKLSYSGENWTASGNIAFERDGNSMYLIADKAETKHDSYVRSFRSCLQIFDNGVWAEIVELPTEPVIDWSVPGQYVNLKDDKKIVLLTTGRDSPVFFFNAMAIKHEGIYEPGYKGCWLKSAFEIFTGDLKTVFE